LDALGATNFARLHWNGERSIDAPRIVAAGSRLFRNVIERPFIAVGDALSCCDPISGQGIVKALRSGIFAAYVAADWLRGDASGLTRYQELAAREFAGYRRTASLLSARDAVARRPLATAACGVTPRRQHLRRKRGPE
jgi:2-polyprenyl-6-methoxyphenol hydroxylase-like FAD-dependent oxidoreductase